MSNSLDAFKSFYRLVLDDVEKEPLYTEEKNQRARLASELEDLRNQISVSINLR